MITYAQAVKELYYTLFGASPTNFHTELYHLIGKADFENKARLRLAFPMEVEVWEDWQKSESQAEYFERYGFKVPV